MRPASSLRAFAWLLGAVACAEIAALLLTQVSSPNAVLWAGLATQGLWVGLALGIASLAGSAPAYRQLGLGPGRLGALSLLLLVVGLLALSDALSVLLVWADLRETGALAEIDAEVARARGPSFVLALLAVALAPGICEELLFRGLVQRALVERFGAVPGIVGAAALFALAHLDPVHSSGAFVLGLYLGAVAQLAGSTRAAMLCHVVNNLLALLTTRLELGGPETGAGLALTALLGVAAAALVFVRWREGPTPPGDSEAATRLPLA